MNRTLKGVLTKYPLEPGANWVGLLSYGRVQCTPLLRKVEKFTPYETVYGRQPPRIALVYVDWYQIASLQSLSP